LVTGVQTCALPISGALRARLQGAFAPMLADAETVLARKLGVGTNPGELVEAGKLPRLVQQLPRELDALLLGDGKSAGAALAADLGQLREAAGSLLVGSERLRIPATTDPRGREALQRLVEQTDALIAPTQAVQRALPAIREAREAALGLEAGAEPLRLAHIIVGGIIIGKLWGCT
jgi:hypothetical protein